MNCTDCKNTGSKICTVCCTYQGGVPDRWEPKPQTNIDILRDMSAEELAGLIWHTLSGFLSYESLLAWLKAPAGEDQTENTDKEEDT